MTRILAAILLAFASVLSCQTTSHSDIIEQVMPDGAPAQMRKLTRAEEVSAVIELRAAQPAATGKRAQQIAFLLAVFGVEYERNRDYLLEVLHRCRAKQNSDCDDDTADLAIGLFERGHYEMLHPLMVIAPESDAGLSETLGTFYSDALTQQPRRFVDEISQLPASGQKAVCRSAGSTDGGGMASDVLNKARRKLRAIGGSVALQCLRQVEIGAKSDQSGAT